MAIFEIMSSKISYLGYYCENFLPCKLYHLRYSKVWIDGFSPQFTTLKFAFFLILTILYICNLRDIDLKFLVLVYASV